MSQSIEGTVAPVIVDLESPPSTTPASQFPSVQKGRSWIWNHFSNKESTKNSETFTGKECNYCGAVYDLRKSGGSTKTLQTHIKNKHPNNITTGEVDSTAFDNYFKPAKEVTKLEFKKSLIDWIVTSDQPFTETEDEYFRKFVLSLNPKAEIPCANTVKNWISELYLETKKALEKIIKEHDGKISVTLDCWTSPSQIPFLGVTAHFINQKWRRFNLLLDFVQINGSHTGENLAAALKETLDNFGINKQNFLGVTTDNATNNDTLCRTLSETFDTFDPDSHRVRCIARIIHLAVTAFLGGLNATPPDIEEWEDFEPVGVVSKFRKLVVKVRGSPQRRQKFLTACKSSGTQELMLQIDVKTRWNSTFAMIKRGITLKEAINIFTSWDQEMRCLALDEKEWSDLESIAEFLEIFEKATTFLCGEKYPTLQFVIPVYNFLLERIDAFRKSANSPAHLKSSATLSYNKISGYYDLTGNNDAPLSELYGTAILLDPTLKTAFFKEKNWTNGSIKYVKDKVKQVFVNCYEITDSVAQEVSPTEIQDVSLVAELYKKRTTKVMPYLLIPVCGTKSVHEVL